jgi:hypothetical protein
MRQTIKEIETNVAYRWFIGYVFTEKIPHFSTLVKNYARRIHNTELFEQIFYRILKEAMAKGLVDPSVTFIDSTHVKANPNKKKFEKKIARVEKRSYQAQLDEEFNIDREEHGKKPSPHMKRKGLTPAALIHYLKRGQAPFSSIFSAVMNRFLSGIVPTMSDGCIFT